MEKPFKKSHIIICIVCISFLQGLQFCISPVLGQIAEHFSGVSTSAVQMLVTMPTFTAMILALASGKLVTVISKKKLLLLASFICFAFGMVPFFVDNFAVLFACRLMYGVTLGIATTLNTAVVAEFFEGPERVSVMGIQGAAVGTGMVVATTVAGAIGKNNFTNAYFLYFIALIAFILLWLFLPETGVVKTGGDNTIKMNKTVYFFSFMCLLEFFFLIAFTTNIAMHLSGKLAGDASISGALTGVFSAIQILAGLALGSITKFTKKYTMTVAMLSVAVGMLLIAFVPANFPLLVVGSILVGLSQGLFMPTGMVGVTNAVPPAGAAMASAILTCGSCVGQTISPVALNTLSRLFFGEVSTNHIFLISAIGMFAVSLVAAAYNKKQK